MNLHDNRIAHYLDGDSLLQELFSQLSEAPALRSVIMDITHKCNARCTGCYFFKEKMDKFKRPDSEQDFDQFIRDELDRGTTYMTVAGGEPALMLARLKRLHQNFRVLPFTNGMKKIPREGFESMPIAVSVWGGHETDKLLRGAGKIDIFSNALKYYKNDDRVTWYYTTTAGNAHEIEDVTDEIVANGNLLMYSFYEDHTNLGGRFNHGASLRHVRSEIDRMIERYPDRILTTSYINKVGTTNELAGERWGYDVCPTIDVLNPDNQERITNGNPYVKHFRAFYPDLKTTRRCCIGEASHCGSCFNVYSKMTWINVNVRKHLDTKQAFTNWLTSNYILHLFVRAIDVTKAISLLPMIHERHSDLREEARAELAREKSCDQTNLLDRASGNPIISQ